MESCSFSTDRVVVKGWHNFSPGEILNCTPESLPEEVARLMSDEDVTRALPPPWQGHYSIARATQWMAERDTESPTLLVVEKETKGVIGLMILFESKLDDGGVNVRLGYLLAKSAWGKGFATELVRGFCSWCSSQISITSISGGVADDILLQPKSC